MEKLGKIKVKKLYDRCLNLVRKKPTGFLLFRKMGSFQGKIIHGYCNWTDLEVNPKGELLVTIYHECVHFLEPDWSETQVIYAESRLINCMSFLDHARFLKYAALKLYKSELLRDVTKQTKRKKIRKNKNLK